MEPSQLTAAQQGVLNRIADEQIRTGHPVPDRVFWRQGLPGEETARALPHLIRIIDMGVQGLNYKLDLPGLLASAWGEQIRRAIENLAEFLRWCVKNEEHHDSFTWGMIKACAGERGQALDDSMLPLYRAAAAAARIRTTGDELTIHLPGDLYLKDMVHWYTIEDVLASHDRWDHPR